MKRIISVLLIAVLLVGVLAACSGDTDKAEVRTIRVANQQAEDHPQTLALYKFKELVEAGSDGALKVEVYPNMQLGSPEAYNDSLLQGAIEMALPGTVMAQSFPRAATPEFPYLFRDWDHARKVLTGPEGDAIHEGMPEDVGVRSLGMMPLAFRVITSNRELSTVEDLEGLRLRVPNIPLYLDFARSLNANVISMSLSELFTALEQNVVDAQENPYSTITTSRFYEVQDYILETRHVFTAHGLYINENFFQSLTEEQRKLIEDAADEAIEYNFDVAIDAEVEAIEYLKEQGVKITVPDETFMNTLREQYKPYEEAFYEAHPGSKELIEAIRAVQ